MPEVRCRSQKRPLTTGFDFAKGSLAKPILQQEVASFQNYKPKGVASTQPHKAGAEETRHYRVWFCRQEGCCLQSHIQAVPDKTRHQRFLILQGVLGGVSRKKLSQWKLFSHIFSTKSQAYRIEQEKTKCAHSVSYYFAPSCWRHPRLVFSFYKDLPCSCPNAAVVRKGRFHSGFLEAIR